MRRWWRHWQNLCDARTLVFLDETGLNTKMARLYGRAQVGERCFGSVPHGHWNSCTFLAALRQQAVTAPFLIKGAVNGEIFLAYIQQSLVPTLNPGDLVICDNLSSHKVKGVRQAIEACGAGLLYLPPYSPDLTPIEMAFAKLKSHLRKACARTPKALLAALKRALEAFTPDHCANFFAHARYAAN